MIPEIILCWIGYSIWQKLQENPARAWREAARRMQAARDNEMDQSQGYRLHRQSSRTAVRHARVNMVNTAEHTQRRVHAQLNGDRRRIQAMSKRLPPNANGERQ